jgi:uncharacterized protein YjiS (DUF1127 family)
MRHFERKYHDQAGARSHNPRPNMATWTTPSLELVAIARNRVRTLRQRRQLRQMLSYDDHTLADIGHCRYKLLRALHLPMNATNAPAVQNIHLQNMHPDYPRVRY